MFKPFYFVAAAFVLLAATACSKKNDTSPVAQPTVVPVVSFSVSFDNGGPESWSRSYTEAECSAPPIQNNFGQGTFLLFKAASASGEECTVDVFGIDRSELQAGIIGVYNGDRVFATEMAFRPRGSTCYIPSTAYTNQHGNPYTFTINSYDTATKRASGTFDLDLGGQANPALCPQQGFGRVRVQGAFRDVILPY